MLVVILVILVVILLLIRWGINKNNVVPMCDYYLPIVGHTYMLIGDTRKLLRSAKRICDDAMKNNGVAIAELASRNYYVITGPEDYIKVANEALQKHYLFRFASSWLGDGLITSSGETWKRHRKMLNPAFSQQMLNSFVSIFNSQARILVSNIENAMKTGSVDSVDVIRLFKQTTLKSLFLTAFGLEIEDKTFNEKYVNAVDEILTILIKRIQNPLLHYELIYKLSSLKRQEDKIIEKILIMSNTVINKKKMAMKNKIQPDSTSVSESNRKSILELLLKDLGEDALTEKDIREQIDTIIVAGYDTTALVQICILLVLGTYPGVQNKLYEEIISVFGDSVADVDKSDYSKLVYCEAVIKETLRLYPVAPITARQTEKEIKLRNCTIPANSLCYLGIYGVNRHPVWGPDADTFRPERWLEPGGVPDSNAFASFSLGKRNCVGKTFALMAIKTILVHLIRRYKVTADISKVEFKLDVLMAPANDFDLKFELRI